MENKKTLFITGANGEIGKAIAQKFNDEGFNIISPGSQELNCGSTDSIKEYFSCFKQQKIDVFVHCAGINNPKNFIDITEDTLKASLHINTYSFLFITQKLLPYFNAEATRIVAIASIYGSVSRNKRLEYATSKHGLIGMVKSLALELAHKKILVNSVSPGFIATQLTYKNNSKEVVDKLIEAIPVGDLGKTSDVAELVYFLCSLKNQFITGQDIVIDGGYLIGGFQN